MPVTAWPIATNALELRTDVAWSQDSIAHAEDWVFERMPEVDNEFVPRPSRIVAIAGGVVLYLDGDMVPGVSYRLTCPNNVDSDLTSQPMITGPLRTVDQVNDPTDAPLSDLAMPGGVDQLGGDITTSLGDYAMTGPRQAIETAVWANLLTPLGRLDWDPAFGTDLGLKRVRAVDLAAEQRRFETRVRSIPGVSSASVQVMFADDQLTVVVQLQLAGEAFRFERGVGDAAQ